MNLAYLVIGLLGGWFLGACAVVAAIVGQLGLRPALNRRRLFWAFGWLFVPWLLIRLTGGPDLATALIGMIDSDVWWAGLPLWVWLGVAAYLIIAVIVSIIRSDIADSALTRR